MTKQTQCPHCQSFKTKNLKSQTLTMAICAILLGAALSFVVIGIPILFIGFALFILWIWRMITGYNQFKCEACGYKFKLGEVAVAS